MSSLSYQQRKQKSVFQLASSARRERCEVVLPQVGGGEGGDHSESV